MEKIYVSFKKPKTVKEFITEFFTKNQYTVSTLKSTTTYKNIECTEIQCKPYKYRSFDDFYKIIKTYYPSYTRKKLMLKLLETKIKYNNTYYHFFPVKCSEIDNYTFLYMSENGTMKPKTWYNMNINSAWNDHSTKATNTWKELFELVGVYNVEDYGKYIH